MTKPIIGMYVHQHWGYNRPYAARTWSFEDWNGYLAGLRRLGYNAVLIWPMLETMPRPLTDSDRANLEKIRRVIELARQDLGMRAYVVLCPNVAPVDEEARKHDFEGRPFFYTDRRIDPRDPAGVADLMARRRELMAPLRDADGVFIIDSDPGGYPGSTNIDFAYLLSAHRKLLDELREGMELYYWVHAGWETYGRFYETGELGWGEQAEVEDAIALAARQAPEPWGVASGRGADVAEALGLSARVLTFSYGAVEGEPSFPLTNYGWKTAHAAGAHMGPRGTMANAQTHCLQLPNTFAFARGAQGMPAEEADYLGFAEELLPGRGRVVVDAWQALAGNDAQAMRKAAEGLDVMATHDLETGPLGGLLFGDAGRFLRDLRLQLEMRAAFWDFHSAAMGGGARAQIAETLRAFADAAARWQAAHGYKNMWRWPELDEALIRLDAPRLTEALRRRDYRGCGETPFEQLRDGFAFIETYTPYLLDALRRAADELS